MNKTLREQLDGLAAFRKEMADLRRLHGLDREHRYEDFEASVRRAFKRGVHRAYQDTVIEFLVNTLGSQQAAAEELGLKNQSSISKKKGSGTIDGPNLTLVMFKYQGRLQLPSKDDAARCGYVSAITHVHNVELDLGPRVINVSDFDWMLAALSSLEWTAAWGSRDLGKTRRATNHLLATESKTEPRPSSLTPGAVEDLVDEWSDSLLLCLDVIPQIGESS